MAKPHAARGTKTSTPAEPAEASIAAMRNAVIQAARVLKSIEERFGLSPAQSIELRQLLLNRAIDEFRTKKSALKPLPTAAPRLWKDRSSSENCLSFLGHTYAPWFDHGLTMADIRKLDRKLYQALAVWQHRHAPVDERTGKKFDPIDALRAAIQRSRDDPTM